MALHLEGGEESPREPDFAHLAALCAEMNRRGVRYVLVGGFAIILHGYPRLTYDIDFLVETTLENEQAALDALMILPDGAAREVRPGEVNEYGVVRIGDVVMVDLMKAGCGVTYSDAANDAVIKQVDGVRIPTASLSTLWKMKQTVREKDAPDRLFLRKEIEAAGLKLDPPPPGEGSCGDGELPPFVQHLINALRRFFRPR